MRILVVAAACALLGGCFIPPPITGDGCPWGGCKEVVAPPQHGERNVLPNIDQFRRGGDFRAGRVGVRLEGDRLFHRSPSCRYEAIQTVDDVRAPETWRAPSPSIQQAYRIVRVQDGCNPDLRPGGLMVALATGLSRSPDRVWDRLWLGAASDGARASILDRR